MTHKNLVKVFQVKFSDLYSQIIEWFPNGNGSIRVRTKNKQEFIFSYYGEKDWRLETVNSYILNLKGEKRK